MRVLLPLVCFVLFAAPLSAQSRMVVTGSLATVEVSLDTGVTRPLTRPGNALGGVAVNGGQYLVTTVPDSQGAPFVHAWAPRTGAVLTTAALPYSPGDSAPALAGDSRQPRVFVWNQQTVSSVTQSGVTPIINAVSVPANQSRLLAYASVANRLVLVRQDADIELAQYDDTGALLLASPLPPGSLPTSVAITSDGRTIYIAVGSLTAPFRIARVDAATGAETATVNLSLTTFSGLPTTLTLDETHGRVLVSHGRGLEAFNSDLTLINAFPFTPSPAGACRFDVGVDRRSGAAIVATTAIPYPYGPLVPRTPVVTGIDVASGAVIGAVALSPSPDSTSGSVAPCGGGSVVLTPPAPPVVDPPAVSGSTVTLAWPAVDDATDYQLEAAVGGGAPVLVTRTAGSLGLVVENVPAGSYTVRVSAVNDSGVGPRSTAVMVTVP